MSLNLSGTYTEQPSTRPPSSTTSKKCEGFNRIPVCVLYYGRVPLLNCMAALFDKIYSSVQIPEQWKVSEIVPIFKKGSKTEIEIYRPIANLCSASKILEKLILKQIHYIECLNKIDFFFQTFL